MQAIHFTVPVSHQKSIILEKYSGPFFYSFLHRHKEFQLMWIIKGKGTLIVDHNIYYFKEGDLFLIGADQTHVFKNDAEFLPDGQQQNIKGLSVFFYPQGVLSPIFNLPELKQAYSFIMQSKGGFKIPDIYKLKISGLLSKLNKTKGANQMSIFFSLIHELYLIKNKLVPLSHSKESGNYTEEKGKRIQEIYDYILKNYENDVSLDEVAEHACLTPPAFCRYFKKHTGKTFVTFLNELRVNEACKMLLSDKEEFQISHIAYDCGFNSVTNFNRVFKTVMGSSPSIYQRMYQSQFRDSGN